MSEHDDIETWLGYLTQVLQPLDTEERDDIVGEARAHLEERLAAGLTATSALTGFGKAEAYARPFLENHAVNQALDGKRPIDMVRVLLSVAGQSLSATIGLVGFGLFTATTVLALVGILLKMVRPELVGLWSGPGVFAFGFLPQPPDAPERLGNAIYPLLIALVIIDAWLVRFSLVATLKGLKDRNA